MPTEFRVSVMDQSLVDMDIILPYKLDKNGFLFPFWQPFSGTASFEQLFDWFPINYDSFYLIVYGNIPKWLEYYSRSCPVCDRTNIGGTPKNTLIGWYYKIEIEEVSQKDDFLHKLYVQTWNM